MNFKVGDITVWQEWDVYDILCDVNEVAITFRDTKTIPVIKQTLEAFTLRSTLITNVFS